MGDEAHKRAQSSLQKKSESASADEMCVEVEKRGGGSREKEKRNTGFVRVCFVVFLFVCNKRATGGQTCWCDFCKKNLQAFFQCFGFEEMNRGSSSL